MPGLREERHHKAGRILEKKGEWDLIEENDANTIRLELVVQLRKSLDRSGSMMLDMNLDPKVRERWTQVNTNTAQVLNQVLRDLQFKDWERRLKAMEQRKRRLQGTISRLEKEATVQQGEPVQDSKRQENDQEAV